MFPHSMPEQMSYASPARGERPPNITEISPENVKEHSRQNYVMLIAEPEGAEHERDLKNSQIHAAPLKGQYQA